MATLTNLNDVKRELSIGTNSGGTLVYDQNLDDGLIQQLISEASAWFERETNRNFNAAQGTLNLDTTHDYVYGRKLLFHDDVLTVTRIENDGVGTLTTSQYATLPRNPRSGEPIYGVELKPNALAAWRWTQDQIGAIKVIGMIGYSQSTTPPAEVELAVRRYAAWLYLNRDNDGTVVRAADGVTEVPGNTPQSVLRTVMKYRREVVVS